MDLIDCERVQIDSDRSSNFSIISLPNGVLLACTGHLIKMIDLQLDVTTWAGTEGGFQDGHRLAAMMREPHGLSLAPNGDVYFCCRENHRIRYVKDMEEVVTFAGTGQVGNKDGPKAQATFNRPYQALHHNGFWYITDWADTVRVISPEGMVSTIGTGTLSSVDGHFSKCSFRFPTGLAVTPDDVLLVAESTGSALRAIDLRSEMVTTYITDANLKTRPDQAPVRLGFLRSVLYHPNGDIYVCDRNKGVIRRITPERFVYNLPRDYAEAETPPFLPAGSCFTPQGDLCWTDNNGAVFIMRNAVPPLGTTKTVPDLTELFQLPSLFPTDLELLQDSTSSTFPVHSYVLSLYPTQPMDALNLFIKGSKLPTESIRTFLSLLYGSSLPTLPSPLDQAKLILDLIGISSHTNIDLFAPWLIRSALMDCLRRLNVAAILSLLQQTKDFASGYYHDMILDRVKLRLRQMKRQKEGTVEFDQLEATDSALFHSLLDPLPGADSETASTDRSGLSSPLNPIGSLNSSLGQQLQLNHSRLAPSEIPSLSFLIYPQGAPDSGVLMFKWVLYVRWSYIRRLMDAGLSEMDSNTVELPPDFPPSLLHSVARYIYSGEVAESCLSLSDCNYVLERGGEYGWLSVDDEATPGFENWIVSCRKLLRLGQRSAHR